MKMLQYRIFILKKQTEGTLPIFIDNSYLPSNTRQVLLIELRLFVVHFRIDSMESINLIMTSVFHKLTFIKYRNVLRKLSRQETVRDQKRRLILGHVFDLTKHSLLSKRVKSGCWLIKGVDSSSLITRSGYGYLLLLTA